MSEEVKEATEETPQVEAEQSAPAKKKKINKLTASELDKKIKDMAEKNLTGSVYYKHLSARKNELGS